MSIVADASEQQYDHAQFGLASPSAFLLQERLESMTESRLSVSSSGWFHPPSLLVRVEIVALVLMIAAGLVAWAAGLYSLGYDYDEVMRAHSIWLVAQGLRPYRDFLDCHPPYFALLAPILPRNPVDPCALLWTLRLLSAAGNLLFLGGLAALGASSVTSGRLWGLLGLAAVALHPTILAFLVEFRIDGWGYALATWSIYRFRRLRPGVYRQFELGVLTGISTLLLCPKLALLSPLIIVFDQLGSWRSVRSCVRAAAAYVAGAGVACGLFALYLAWQGIEFDRMYQMVVRYNAVHNANAGYRFRLLQSLVNNKSLFWVILAGVIGWAVSRFRHGSGSRADAYLPALAVWLGIQAFLVAYPFKQYYAPWFLFASIFLVFLGRGVSELLGRAGVLVFLTACIVTALADLGAAQSLLNSNEAATHRLLIRWMNNVTRPEDRVVASPPLHPIDRYDTFFLWFNTFDPSGFDAERILERIPPYQGYVSPGRFRKELEDHPPAIVVLSGDWRIVPYTSGQWAALTDFLRQHRYQAVPVGPAWFALRPDRFEQARSVGLLEGAVGRWASPRG
jgi:hypothetical protein